MRSLKVESHTVQLSSWRSNTISYFCIWSPGAFDNEDLKDVLDVLLTASKSFGP